MQLEELEKEQVRKQLGDKLRIILTSMPESFRGNGQLTAEWVCNRLSDEEYAQYNALLKDNPLTHYLWFAVLLVQTKAYRE